MKYNISYKLYKYVKFGTLNKYDDGNMGFTVTEEQLEKLLQVIKMGHFNDKKVKEFNNKKYYTLYVFEDNYNKQNNTIDSISELKSDSMDEVPF
jgi:CRISPR/Cas system type I-B associated protein Csh2 (Cas7 group RAMP superfamily)